MLQLGQQWLFTKEGHKSSRWYSGHKATCLSWSNASEGTNLWGEPQRASLFRVLFLYWLPVKGVAQIKGRSSHLKVRLAVYAPISRTGLEVGLLTSDYLIKKKNIPHRCAQPSGFYLIPVVVKVAITNCHHTRGASIQAYGETICMAEFGWGCSSFRIALCHLKVFT